MKGSRTVICHFSRHGIYTYEATVVVGAHRSNVYRGSVNQQEALIAAIPAISGIPRVELGERAESRAQHRGSIERHGYTGFFHAYPCRFP